MRTLRRMRARCAGPATPSTSRSTSPTPSPPPPLVSARPSPVPRILQAASRRARASANQDEQGPGPIRAAPLPIARVAHSGRLMRPGDGRGPIWAARGPSACWWWSRVRCRVAVFDSKERPGRVTSCVRWLVGRSMFWIGVPAPLRRRPPPSSHVPLSLPRVESRRDGRRAHQTLESRYIHSCGNKGAGRTRATRV